MNPRQEENHKLFESTFSPTLQIFLKGTNFPMPSYLKIYQKNSFIGNNWILFAATEVNDSDPHPFYPDTVKFQYIFPILQEIKVELYKVSMEDNNLYGSTEFNIVSLIRNKTKSIERSLKGGSPNKKPNEDPLIKLTIDEAIEIKDALTLLLAANFTKKTIFAPKTSFSLWRSYDHKDFKKVLQSDFATGNNPTWPKIQLKVSNQFKSSGVLRMVLHDKSDKILGHGEFTFHDIVEEKKKSFPLIKMEITPQDKSKVENISQGTIEIVDSLFEKVVLFNDYLQNGLEIQFQIAIDYSCFYDGMSESTTMETQKLFYRQMLSSLSTILLPYTEEKMILGYGIGGDLLDSHQDFFLLKGKDYAIQTPESLVEAFDSSFQRILQKKSIRLSPLIQDMTMRVKTDIILSQKVKYYLSIIVISEAIPDLQEVIDNCVLASYEAPISFLLLATNKKIFNEKARTLLENMKDSRNRQVYRKNLRLLFLEDCQNHVQAVVKILEETPKDIFTLFNKMNISPIQLESGAVYKKYLEMGNLISSFSYEEFSNASQKSPSENSENNIFVIGNSPVRPQEGKAIVNDVFE